MLTYKKIDKVLLTGILLLLMSCGSAKKSGPLYNSAPDGINTDNFDIYLLIGQSNMAGRAKITKEVSDTLQNVYLFTGSHWEKAANPLNRYSKVRKPINMQKLGPGYTFAQSLAQQTDHEIGLVVNARGGTSIEQWEKGYTGKKDYNLYENALERIKRVVNNGTIKAIIWHQGEANQHRSSTYMEKLKKLVQNYRSDLGMPELYFVVGQLGKWRSSSVKINKIIQKIPQKIPHSAYVKTDGLTPLRGDSAGPHFDSRSQQILGKRYAKKVLNKLYE